jgi:hypothetical protein
MLLQRNKSRTFSGTMKSRRKNVSYLTGIVVAITVVVVVSLLVARNSSNTSNSEFQSEGNKIPSSNKSNEEFPPGGNTIPSSNKSNEVIQAGGNTISSSNKSNDEFQPVGNDNISSPSGSNVIVEGSSGGIPYLRCSSSSQMTELVLLHGASFSKEIWRSKGMLAKICRHFSVMALDLHTSAGHNELEQVLDAMKEDGLCKLPVSIVTPSASGNTIVDWLSDMQVMKRYIRKWIPVASPAIALGDKSQLQELGDWLPILAIYGDRDKAGKRLSNILGDWSKANVTEIPGGHPCYLDSPDLFVQLLHDFLSE